MADVTVPRPTPRWERVEKQQGIRRRTDATGRVRWQASWRERDPATGRWASRAGTFDTLRAAKAARAKIRSDQATGSHVDRSRLTVAQYLVDEWLPGVRSGRRAKATKNDYEGIVRRHLVPRLGAVPLQALTPRQVEQLKDVLLAEGRVDGQGGLSSRSVQYVLVVLGAALDDALKRGLLQRNPVRLVDGPRRQRKEIRVWGPEQLGEFLRGAVSNRLYPAFVLAATTGMRRGEVCGLRWADVDLEEGRLSVVGARVVVGYAVEESSTKTAAGRRSVRLDVGTVAALRAWRTAQMEERLAWGPAYEASGLLFTKEDGSPIHPQTLSVAFGRLVRKLGLPRITFHGLRHSWATCALKSKVHVKVVQERLGHSSSRVTLDTYSHVIGGMDQDAADVVAGAIFGSLPGVEAPAAGEEQQ